ncbi:anthranilate phosphoribosyltransferase [Paucilactobacillus nenjiangensis]|uniref:anthranilate phosphoribosyltransferase n=1 Tax=Paucilactobacillus nenjiangensis TaxID=1296540 RepID=UPI0010F8189E|nr:anthranilate phosphoribosyltransferase [Paucilactobacillus nenjiangensis]
MIESAIKKLSLKEELSFEEAETVMNEIMDGKTDDIQIAAYLTALNMKDSNPDEIAGSAKAMRNHAEPFEAGEEVLEIVGTGGDHSNSFNISSTSAIVVAAAGIPVAKHGNRAASSKSGAADVLEALGMNINLTPLQSEKLLKEAGFAFLFAQEYHKAMRYVSPVRKELGIRTVFNVLGPLTNPAHASRQLLGVYDQKMMQDLANVLVSLNVTDAMVVHGQDGLDEVTLTTKTDTIEIRNGKMTKYEINPLDYGFELCKPEDLVGGTPAENAAITRAILNGEKGPKRDVVLLNAGAALHVANPELSLADGINKAAETINSGLAAKKLDQIVTFTKGAVA